MPKDPLNKDLIPINDSRDLISGVIDQNSVFSNLLVQVNRKISEYDIAKIKNENQQKAALVISQLANDKFFPDILEEISDIKLELTDINIQKKYVADKIKEFGTEVDKLDKDIACWLYDGSRSDEDISKSQNYVYNCRKELKEQQKLYASFETIFVNRSKMLTDKYKLLGVDNSKMGGIMLINNNDNSNQNPFKNQNNQPTQPIQSSEEPDFIDMILGETKTN
jgi:hypothetical protein